MWPFSKKQNFRRPNWGEKVKGALGYFGEERGMPAMEFMDELAPPAGLHKFRKMRMQDPIVGGLIIQIENIMRRLSWTVDGELRWHVDLCSRARLYRGCSGRVYH